MVNESVYGDEDSLVRVRIINLSPVDSGEEEDTDKKNDRPETSGPITSSHRGGHRRPHTENEDSDEADEQDNDRREPLLDNEIHRNEDIDTTKVKE